MRRRAWARLARSLSARLLLALALVLLGAACDKAVSPAAHDAAATPIAPAPSRPVAAAPPAAPAPSPVEASTAPTASAGEEPLVEEAHERDPRSATVTIKLIVDPRRKAHVFWGRKDLGLAPLELQRPRDSGPMDLVVTAVGYLPLHTRVFTDRNDQLNLRLFSAQEAPQLLGYSAPEPAPPPRRSPPKEQR